MRMGLHDIVLGTEDIESVEDSVLAQNNYRVQSVITATTLPALNHLSIMASITTIPHDMRAGEREHDPYDQAVHYDSCTGVPKHIAKPTPCLGVS